MKQARIALVALVAIGFAAGRQSGSSASAGRPDQAAVCTAYGSLNAAMKADDTPSTERAVTKLYAAAARTRDTTLQLASQSVLGIARILGPLTDPPDHVENDLARSGEPLQQLCRDLPRSSVAAMS